ncbi:MAG TPA: molybdenum cofactor biosynthesis protein MoaE [Candidatus Cryosericum sp.]|nr:molybdenum cofactor biosynthesis protein MoaE [Candidatus Cryosericum sp.]
MAAHCRITEDPIRPDELVRAVVGPDRGALATFAGVVRDHHAGRAVLRLEYHAYVAMAEQILGEIAGETSRRFGTPHVAIVHRIGRLAIGETSVLVAVAAAHRREALAACAFAIDRVKAQAPIWKKEYYEDGAVWIEGPESDGGCGADR